MFLVKLIISRYFRQFSVVILSAVMTKGYTDTLLSYQASLISRAKFSDFVIFSRSREVLYLLQVLFCSLSRSPPSLSLSTSTVSGLLKSTVSSDMITCPSMKPCQLIPASVLAFI